MKLSLVVPIRGDRDIVPLLNSIHSNSVEVVVVRYEYTVWNISRAVNIGIRKCIGDIIAKVDADMVLLPGFIDDVIGAGDRFCVAPVKRQAVGQCIDEVLEMPIWGDLNAWYWPCGGWQSAPREFWFDLHGYDEDMIFYGAEDTDMWNRAHEAGIPIEIVDPIMHRWHESKAHDWAFFHVGNAKLREHRRRDAMRNRRGWGKKPRVPAGIELALWLLRCSDVLCDIRDGSVGGVD